MLTLYIVLAIVFFSNLFVMYKLAHTKGCNTVAFVGILKLSAGLICLSSMLLTGPAWPKAPGGVLALGITGGLAGALCLTSMVGALKRNGPLAIVHTLGNLSLLLPIIFATVFLGERITWVRAAGLGLFVVFVALLNLSGGVDDGMIPAPMPESQPRKRLLVGWLPLAFATFLLNGIVLITQRSIVAWYTDGESLFLLGMFLTGALACALALAWQRRVPTVRDLAVGSGAGMMSYGGSLCLVRALGMSESYHVLPLVFGVWIVIVALISWIIFGERLNLRSGIALVIGIFAIVLLNTSSG